MIYFLNFRGMVELQKATFMPLNKTLTFIIDLSEVECLIIEGGIFKEVTQHGSSST